MALLEGISQHYIFILKDKQTFRVDNGISMSETGYLLAVHCIWVFLKSIEKLLDFKNILKYILDEKIVKVLLISLLFSTITIFKRKPRLMFQAFKFRMLKTILSYNFRAGEYSSLTLFLGCKQKSSRGHHYLVHPVNKCKRIHVCTKCLFRLL